MPAFRLASKLEPEVVEALRDLCKEAKVTPIDEVMVGEPTLRQMMEMDYTLNRPEHYPIIIRGVLKLADKPDPAWPLEFCNNLPMTISPHILKVCNDHMTAIQDAQKQAEKDEGLGDDGKKSG